MKFIYDSVVSLRHIDNGLWYSYHVIHLIHFDGSIQMVIHEVAGLLEIDASQIIGEPVAEIPSLLVHVFLVHL